MPENGNICNNCHAKLEPDDKYCMHCGTKRGEGVYKPRRAGYETVYGPPYAAKYLCEECGIAFTVKGLGAPRTKYCPICGKPLEGSNLGRRAAFSGGASTPPKGDD